MPINLSKVHDAKYVRTQLYKSIILSEYEIAFRRIFTFIYKQCLKKGYVSEVPENEMDTVFVEFCALKFPDSKVKDLAIKYGIDIKKI